MTGPVMSLRQKKRRAVLSHARRALSRLAAQAAGFGLARELAGPRHAPGVAEEPAPSSDVVAAADHCLQGLEWTVEQS